MTNPAPKNLPASVRQKLLDLVRKRNADFSLLLVKYGLERILYRLNRSSYRDVFILKGALLFALWTEQRYRPTRDADFLARGDNSLERFVRIFQELCTMKSEADGLIFDPDTVAAERITEDADYQGIRVTFTAYLDRAKIPMQIDIGFGDAVTPAPLENAYPTLLEFPGPRLLTCPRETVVAEKLEAMVKLGIANSRMKDFYDLEVLARTYAFDGMSLAEVVQNTFRQRGTGLPPAGIPLAVTPDFYDDRNKVRQWDGLLCEEQELHRANRIQDRSCSHRRVSRSGRPLRARRRFLRKNVEAWRPLALVVSSPKTI